jgi:glycine cleavage system aminomethyltransferase T
MTCHKITNTHLTLTTADQDIVLISNTVRIGAFIDLGKADFIGKPALLEAERQPLLYGIKCLSDTPCNQAEIMDGQICVGRVTASGWSSYLECGIGYVRFNKVGDWAGNALNMKTQQGELVSCEILTLPFYDAEKRIPRGLELTGC